MIPGSGFQLRIKRSAEREMDRLSKPVFERIKRVILALERNPRPQGSEKLSGFDEYRIRVGDYRVLYTIDDAARLVEIMAVGHRREIYRRH